MTRRLTLEEEAERLNPDDTGSMCCFALSQDMKNEWFTTEEVAEYFKIGVSSS